MTELLDAAEQQENDDHYQNQQDQQYWTNAHAALPG